MPLDSLAGQGRAPPPHSLSMLGAPSHRRIWPHGPSQEQTTKRIRIRDRAWVGLLLRTKEGVQSRPNRQPSLNEKKIPRGKKIVWEIKDSGGGKKCIHMGAICLSYKKTNLSDGCFMSYIILCYHYTIVCNTLSSHPFRNCQNLVSDC